MIIFIIMMEMNHLHECQSGNNIPSLTNIIQKNLHYEVYGEIMKKYISNEKFLLS